MSLNCHVVGVFYRANKQNAMSERSGMMWDIFKTFFTLGCVGFGGPAAHIGFFRATFVVRLAWLSEKQYADIVALSQFLPGPGSSQVGFAIGHHRGGIKGALLAFIGFTLPSILLMLLLVFSAEHLAQSSVFNAVIHALKLLAVVVVLDAVLVMYRQFCQDNTRILLCLLSACVLLIWPGMMGQIGVLFVAALVGGIYLKPVVSRAYQGSMPAAPVRHRYIHYPPLIVFLSLLFAVPLLAHLSPVLKVFSDFFQAGSLVFGGGHVVLPLLQSVVGEQVSANEFLTGYALAQAVPGPMFTFATYLGYFLLPSAPVVGALLATVAVFLPVFLLLLVCLKHWQILSQMPLLAAAISGVNAAVVGLLVSALYEPVFTSAVITPMDMAWVLCGVYLLKCQKLPMTALVGIFMVAGVCIGLL